MMINDEQVNHPDQDKEMISPSFVSLFTKPLR